MGPALNISTEVTARDLDAWIGSGYTCLENGGMAPLRIVPLATSTIMAFGTGYFAFWTHLLCYEVVSLYICK